MVNKLKLNVSKSNCMLIGSRQRSSGKCLHLMLNGDVLRQTSAIKYLGVYIDQHLTWNAHIDYVLNRVRGIVLIGLGLLLVRFCICCIKLIWHANLH